MKKLRCRVVKVFTNGGKNGNLLGVVTDVAGLGDAGMQKVAATLGYSETSFVFAPSGKGEDYRVRFFTPERELPFAGHPTLGTLFTLRALGLVKRKSRYVQRIGPRLVPLSIRPGGLIVMEQGPPSFLDCADRSFAASLLGCAEEKVVGVSRTVSTGLPVFIVPLADEKDLNGCRIADAVYKRMLKNTGSEAVLPFAVTPKGVRCRMFAPAFGIAEDPATGGACGPLASYLVHEKMVAPGSRPIKVFQGKKGLQSLLLVWVRQSGKRITGVAVGGYCTPHRGRTVTV